jgi:hypothetical protein
MNHHARDFLHMIAATALVAATAGLLAACAAPTAVSITGTPWYEKYSGAYRTDAGNVFYGIGVAEPQKSRSLQRVNADNRARHEIAGVIDQYSKALAVAATQTGGSRVKSLPADQVRASLNMLVRQAMQRAIVVDHWTDPQNRRMKALCTLDLAQYQSVLAQQTFMDPGLRSSMQHYSEMLFDQLSGHFHGN